MESLITNKTTFKRNLNNFLQFRTIIPIFIPQFFTLEDKEQHKNKQFIKILQKIIIISITVNKSLYVNNGTDNNLYELL